MRCSAAGRAALTMFRVSTGDDWVYIMQQCGVRPPVCTVSVSLTISTCHNASPLGYILPAAAHYDVQLCLVTVACRIQTQDYSPGRTSCLLDLCNSVTVTCSCRCLQAPGNAAHLLRTLHSSGMVHGRLGQSQNVEHALITLFCSQGGCGNPILSALFFCSFTVIITMILLNLFTAVVLENFEIQEEQAEWTLTPAALEV